ncbi:hypothetical protein BC828DRAFT_414424 [Blastocladiella britannica]|nr:hypothetical protein BC828DRAFT_414424 [Blastocladiella britannica]
MSTPANVSAAISSAVVQESVENRASPVGPTPLGAVATSQSEKERLAQRIARRPSKADLKLRNIIRVDSSDNVAAQAAAAAGAAAAAAAATAAAAAANGSVDVSQGSIKDRSSALRSCLKKRPEREELMQKNILKESDVSGRVDASLAVAADQLKRAQLADQLESQLVARPNPDELPSRVLKFVESVEVLPTFRKTEYNRRPDSNSTFRKLTPKLKMEIREELNTFKKTEMPVHSDSASNTAFH